eukprot:10173936-Alexandrium_andersonii.AAC.1
MSCGHRLPACPRAQSGRLSHLQNTTQKRSRRKPATDPAEQAAAFFRHLAKDTPWQLLPWPSAKASWHCERRRCKMVGGEARTPESC